MTTVTGLVVALVFLVDNVEADFFLIAASRPGKVLRLAPETYDTYTMAFDSPLQSPIALDSDPENERIYWTEGKENFMQRKYVVTGAVAEWFRRLVE
ncbi:hypothetical protein ACOMHN_017404 [Nucella lapillus]